MPAPKIMTGHIRQGIWTARLDYPRSTMPNLEVVHDGKPLAGMTLSAPTDETGGWRLSIPIPAGTLSDGVQIYLVRDVANDTVIGHIPILMGEGLADSLATEVALLRAELEVVKRALLQLAAPDRD